MFRSRALHIIDLRAKPPGTSPSVVLIVEDDPFVRMFAVVVVEEAGFVALEAANADEAVAILEARSDISLLFTDIDMPGSMDGLKLAHAVKDRWPKILVVSGLARPRPKDCRRIAALSKSHIERLQWSRNCVRWPVSPNFKRRRDVREAMYVSHFAQTWR